MIVPVILERPDVIEAPALLPWASWNLRWNPFGEPPAEDLPALVVAEIDDLLEWLERPKHAVQLIGHAGRGKSSHLHALRGRMPHLPFVYLAEGERRMPEFEGRHLLLDEAQRLPRRRRRRLFARLDWLALSTHEDLVKDLEAMGWTVWTLEVGGLDRDKLESVLERRLEWARRGPGALPGLSPGALEMLLRRHGDDLRSILDDLYETTQHAVAGTGTTDQEKRHGEV